MLPLTHPCTAGAYDFSERHGTRSSMADESYADYHTGDVWVSVCDAIFPPSPAPPRFVLPLALRRPTSYNAQLALPKLGDVILCCSRAGRTLESTKRSLEHATEHDSLFLLQPFHFNLLQFPLFFPNSKTLEPHVQMAKEDQFMISLLCKGRIQVRLCVCGNVSCWLL